MPEAAAETRHDDYPNAYLLGILNGVRTIAMVGASPNWNRPSYFAMKYLQAKGYRVIPVNPRAAGTEILGEPCYASLKDIPDRFDMVDIFRASDAAGGIVDEAIGIAGDKGIRVIWMQLGVRDDAAARRAEDAGLQVVMNRCPKIEFGRLNAELSWGGFNSKVISSKRRRVSLS
ncbi:CoA-binding protein [Ferruginivarius sediminum]|uniref:CoA-binding protein n=2 Tax=Ferruginivarius sediminum TaxID=2661937 RepID=A0A369T7H3_9PROT|nr:CoA-binding protein [Ferruginivarius sediminum]RDD61260.1 CoA-binding protein [Ferruginivarius sediminum]